MICIRGIENQKMTATLVDTRNHCSQHKLERSGHMNWHKVPWKVNNEVTWRAGLQEYTGCPVQDLLTIAHDRLEWQAFVSCRIYPYALLINQNQSWDKWLNKGNLWTHTLLHYISWEIGCICKPSQPINLQPCDSNFDKQSKYIVSIASYLWFVSLKKQKPQEKVWKLTFLPTSSFDEMRSSSSRACCWRIRSSWSTRSWSSSRLRVKFRIFVSFSLLSFSIWSRSAANLQIYNTWDLTIWNLYILL